MAAESIQFDALQHRIKRYRDRVQQIASGECAAREDDYFYTNEELMQAYDDAEAAASVVIEAYVKYHQALKHINQVRLSIEKPDEQKEQARRNLGSGALNYNGVGDRGENEQR